VQPSDKCFQTKAYKSYSLAKVAVPGFLLRQKFIIVQKTNFQFLSRSPIAIGSVPDVGAGGGGMVSARYIFASYAPIINYTVAQQVSTYAYKSEGRRFESSKDTNFCIPPHTPPRACLLSS
jgi:hypothetical protein